MSRKPITKPSAAEADRLRREAEEGEVPELGADFFERARVRIGGEVIREANGTLTRRGRPPHGARAKVQQSLRLSPEVIEHFRAGGPGWQARIDEVLRKHVGEEGAGAGVAEEQAGYEADRSRRRRPGD